MSLSEEEQRQAPLFEALAKYVKTEKTPFHTPGHKQGKGIDAELKRLVGQEIFKFDLTVLEETDCLFHPIGAIREAQELAAQAYGADKSYFLINGSTGGNLAMLLGVLFPGDKVIVPRNAHKSVLAGLILTGAIPIYVSPGIDEERGFVKNVTAETIEKVLKEHPDIRGVFISSPTYQGISADLLGIVKFMHQYHKIVMVDQAHGPHFHFHPDLPISAMDAEADICVESTHKIISGLTQSAMLHIKGERIDLRDLENILLIIQSTSPSYLLMISLDLARRQMATQGKELLDKIIALSNRAREEINHLDGLYCLQPCDVTPFSLDPTKLTVFVKELGLTGFKASRILDHQYHIQPEMADIDSLLFLITIGDEEQDLKKLITGLKNLGEKHRENNNHLYRINCSLPKSYPPLKLSPREAFFAKYKTIPLSEAIGEISTEIFSVYPPGIPVIAPGEEITKEAVEYLQMMERGGATMVGPSDQNGGMVRVVA
ncbi:MAG: aminotransferase class I/II-fold pyridoxal phosphate-dependent enzyme [Candidatus Edwardsbacteria bacterium]